MSNQAIQNNESHDGIAADTELPYRYHEQQQDMLLGGWCLPAHYVFNADGLQEWLLKLPNWQRIKGMVHTSDGWLKINFTPDSLTITTTSAHIDSRLEVILQTDNDLPIDNVRSTISLSKDDWQAYDQQLMALVLEDRL